MLAVCQACQFFLPDIRGHHVLVHSDSRSVVSYINHQDGLVSKQLCTLANDLLVWAQTNLRSLKATHVMGKMNHGADMLSRNNVSSGEWTLHPLAVQKVCEDPWQIPLRRDLLSQANGRLWHPRPKLWALYVWPLNESLSASQSVSQTQWQMLEPRLLDASTLWNGLFSRLGVKWLCQWLINSVPHPPSNFMQQP